MLGGACKGLFHFQQQRKSLTSHCPSVNLTIPIGRKEGHAMNLLELKETLEEQTKDTINILQLLETSLAENEDDPHIIRTVNILQKMLQEHLRTLQHLSSDYESTQQSFSEP